MWKIDGWNRIEGTITQKEDASNIGFNVLCGI